MSQLPKISVANYREFKDYPKIEEAWSRDFVVVGKRNPFAAQEVVSTLPEIPKPNDP